MLDWQRGVHRLIVKNVGSLADYHWKTNDVPDHEDQMLREILSQLLQLLWLSLELSPRRPELLRSHIVHETLQVSWNQLGQMASPSCQLCCS